MYISNPKRIAIFVFILDLILFLAGYKELNDDNGMEILGILLMLFLPVDIVLYYLKFIRNKKV